MTDAQVATEVQTPAPASTEEWAKMRAAKPAEKPLAVVPSAERAIEAVAPEVTVEPEAPVVEQLVADLVPVKDEYEGVPQELAAKLKRERAALVGETTKERHRRREAEKVASEAKANSDAQQARLDKMQATLDKLAAANEKPEEPRPVRTNFDSPDAYEQARDAWVEKHVVARESAKAAELVKAEQTRLQRETVERTQAEQTKVVQDAWADRRAKAIEANPDYEIIAEADDVKIAEPMAVAIMQSDNGPDIAIYLGMNKAEAERIASLAPPRQFMEIGRIAAKLEAQAQAKAAAVVSRDRTPIIKPVGGVQAATAPSLYDLAANRDMKGYATMRTEQLRLERVNGHAGR